MKPTRAGEYEVEQQCRAAGFSDMDTRLIVLRTAGNSTAKEAAQQLGRSPSWAKRKTITNAIKLWREGKAIGNRLHLVATEPEETPEAEPSAAPTPVESELNLAELTDPARIKRRLLLGEYTVNTRRHLDPTEQALFAALNASPFTTSDFTPPASTWLEEQRLLAAGKPLGEAIAAAVRQNPSALLDPAEGRRLVAALVDLLEAANSGDSMRRVPGVVTDGKPDHVKRKARQAVSLLTARKTGKTKTREVNPVEVWRLARDIGKRVAELQAECRAPKINASARVAEILGKHGAELARFTRKELAGYLTDKPDEVALRIIAKATGTHPDLWRRCLKEHNAMPVFNRPPSDDFTAYHWEAVHTDSKGGTYIKPKRLD
jgi:hypothetical protein